MTDLILISKFLVAIISVLGLSILFERINPKIAGLLSGYPIGTAITLFFFGFENGAEFASKSAVFNVVGLAAFLTFIFLYYRASKMVAGGVIIFSTIVSVSGYFVVAYLLRALNFEILGAIVFSALTIPIFAYLMRHIRDIETGNKIKFSISSLTSRALFIAVMIAAITSVAGLVGPEWAGLLSSFPATTLPLILMVHYKHSTLHVHALLKHIPEGCFSLIFYSGGVFYMYPLVGIYLGTLIAYALATTALVLSYFAEDTSFISKCKQILGVEDKMKVHFIMTGGSIDSYYDGRKDYMVPNKKSAIPEFIEGLKFVDAEFTEICLKDSRSLTDGDMKKLLKTIEQSPYKKIIVTSGTYKMDGIAKYITDNLKRDDQTVVITGACLPLVGFAKSDGPFNLGHALASVKHLSPGVYISFHGDTYSSKDVAQLMKEGGIAQILKANPNAPVY